VIEFSDVTVAHTIQLAVAPVFLLSGIGAILVVMTNRLGRIIDRARYWRTDWTTLRRNSTPHCASISRPFRGEQS
jgi:Protein of unknown function (DUF2721)